MSEQALLTHEETLLLLRRAQAGDESAKDRLVACNLALVKSVVKKYLGRGVEYDDLYQLGCMGLVKAVSNFDTRYNVRFSTYAVPMIAGEIKRFLRDDGMVKVSRSLKELAIRAMAVQERLGRRAGAEAGVLEIAQELDVSPEEIALALEAGRPHISLNEPVYEDEGAERLELIEDGANELALIDRLLLRELLEELEPRERQIILLRYFRDKTQTEIAGMLGVSQVQVSRLESRILKKLRERCNREPDFGVLPSEAEKSSG